MTLIKELKSGMKIGKFYLIDICFVVIYWLVFFFFRSFVSSSVLIPYYIFNFIVAIILVIPSMWNPGKRTWQAILFIFIKSRKIYKPISVNERSEDFE